MKKWLDKSKFPRLDSMSSQGRRNLKQKIVVQIVSVLTWIKFSVLLKWKKKLRNLVLWRVWVNSQESQFDKKRIISSVQIQTCNLITTSLTPIQTELSSHLQLKVRTERNGSKKIFQVNLKGFSNRHKNFKFRASDWVVYGYWYLYV